MHPRASLTLSAIGLGVASLGGALLVAARPGAPEAASFALAGVFCVVCAWLAFRAPAPDAPRCGRCGSHARADISFCVGCGGDAAR